MANTRPCNIFMLINTVSKFYESLDTFTDDLMVIDCETTGLDVWQLDRLCGIGVSTKDGKTYYYPFRHKDDKFPLLGGLHGPLNLPLELLQTLFQRLYQVKKLIGHNVKFDITAMHADGFLLPDETEVEDTMVAARLCFHAGGFMDDLSLEGVVDSYFPDERANDWKVKFKEHMKKGKYSSYDQVHPEVVAEYCERDCAQTFKIHGKLLEYIEETKQTAIWEQEKFLLPIVWEMEREGLYFDRQYVTEKIAQLQRRVDELSREICDGLGQTINVGSTPQLTDAMNAIGIYSPKKTKAKKQSWDNDALMKLGHPIGAKILSYRSFQKMLGTYLIPALRWTDDRMHPRFNQARPITGRFSCADPNLQNLINGSFVINPEGADAEAVQALTDALVGGGGTEVAEEFSGLIAQKFKGSDNEVSIKRMFVPPPGYKLWLFDFDQMEMRVFADYVKDPNMSDLLENKHFDFHKFVATTVWGARPGTAQWKFYRKLAKAINFGLIFCVGDEKLGTRIQKTTQEAGQYKLDYFSRFPMASVFIQKVIDTVKTRGFVFNKFGRRYYIDKDRAYVGINYLIQGSSADIVKNRMIACAMYLKENNLLTKMVVQVHDELVFYVHESEESFVPAKLKAIIEERQIDTFLPIKAERGNPSWVEKEPTCVHCLKALTTEEDEGDVTHPCDEPGAQKQRRIQVK